MASCLSSSARADAMMIVADSTDVFFARRMRVSAAGPGLSLNLGGFSPGEVRKFYGETYYHAVRATTIVGANSERFVFEVSKCPLELDMTDRSFVITVIRGAAAASAVQTWSALRKNGAAPCAPVRKAAFDSALAVASEKRKR
jgi:hypothetical protein